MLSTTAISREMLVAICKLKQTHWNHPIESQLAWFSSHVAPDDAHILAEAHGEIVGYVRLPSVAALLDGVACRAWGISTVIVSPDLRGQNVGQELVRIATAEMQRSPLKPLGVLQCSRGLVPFYARAGWLIFPGVLKCRKDDVLTEFIRDECAMVYPGVHHVHQDSSLILLTSESF